MFNNRFVRRPETTRTLVRPSLNHLESMAYGPMSYNLPINNREHRSLHGISTLNNWNTNIQNHVMVSAPADVLELDEQFIIEVALPGVVLDDVQLKIEENVLSICAKRTPTLFEERATVIQKELPSVYLLRQFEFDTEIIAEQIDARLDRGILYISIPKVEAALRVPVSAGMIDNHMPSTSKTRVSSKHEVSVK